MVLPFVDQFDTQMPFPLELRQQAANIGARDSIPTNARWEGMIVYCVNEKALYCLKGGVANEFWTPIGGAGVGNLQSVVFNSDAPINSQGADGDIWFRPNVTVVELYQKGSGVWVKLGEWGIGGGGGVTVVRDDGLAYGLTSSQLNLAFPTMPVGGLAYSKTNGVEFVKLQDDDWKVSNIEIA